MKRFFLVVFLSAIPFGIVRSQTVPQPILVAERANANYELMLQILDLTAITVAKHPGSKCIIVVAGKNDEVHKDLFLEIMVRKYFTTRAGPLLKDRWKFVRARQTGQRSVKAWVIPEGVAEPEIDAADWSLLYPARTKPFLITDCGGYPAEWEPEPCSYADDIYILARLLEADQNARTNVVLKVRSRMEFAARKRKTLANLRNSYGINAKQVRFFKVTLSPNADEGPSTVEYWFVP